MAKIKGTNAGETLNGTAFKDKISGRGGDDVLNGLDGDDRLHGGRGNDELNGSAGRDRLEGGKGDDLLFGGAGDDYLDGGRGFDTAVFGGNYADYTIDSHHHHGHHGHHGHDDHLTVTGADGVDRLEDVERLQFDDGFYDVASKTFYGPDATLDDSAQKPGTDDMIAGSGIPADHFGIVRDEDAGLELGLKVHKRFDSPSTIVENDPNDYADGALHFQVDAGPGNPPTSNRAEWNFDYSIAAGLNGETTGLSDFTFNLLVDVDKGTGTDFHVWEMRALGFGSANTHWTDVTNPLLPFDIIGDDSGVANKVSQNSENYGFGFIRPFIDDNPGTPAIDPYNFGPGQFDIILQAHQGTELVASNHIVVDVV